MEDEMKFSVHIRDVDKMRRGIRRVVQTTRGPVYLSIICNSYVSLYAKHCRAVLSQIMRRIFFIISLDKCFIELNG